MLKSISLQTDSCKISSYPKSAYQSVCLKLSYTRSKPGEHGDVFSMAVGTIGKGLKRVPFFVKRRTVDSAGGGGWQYLGRQTP